jgi:FtsZ-interacting cell division protein ZipA
MDKFDQTIKNVKNTVEPSANFVDMTMSRITNHRAKPRFGLRLWLPILGSVAVIAILFLGLSSGSNTSSSKTPLSATSKSGSTSQTASTSPTSGDNNAALVGYLSGIQGSMSQENTDQNSANSSINDSSQEITVPTD